LIIIAYSQGINGGSVNQNSDLTFNYNPAPGYSGTDHFIYIVSDNRGGLVTGNVHITLYPLATQPSPQAIQDFFYISQTVTTINVIANDNDVTADTIVVVSKLPQHGNVILANNTEVKYSPNPNFQGEDSFSYLLLDDRGNTSEATVFLNVSCLITCYKTFSLSWNPSTSSDIVSYKLYVGTQKNAYSETYLLGNATNVDYSVALPGNYYFAVSSVNSLNQESELSKAVTGIY